MSLADDYRSLFDCLQRIVAERPDQVPQLLATILAGGPFRPALDKPEVLNKIVALAKGYVAQKKGAAHSASTQVPAGERSPAKAPPRTVSARDFQPATGLTRA